jgi:hypothetical protein
MKNLIFILIFCLTFPQSIIGEDLTGTQLLEYIQDNYTPTSTMGYNTARDTMYAVIDLKEGNQLSGVYSGYTITLDLDQDPSSNAYSQGINCEHTFPQSMGAGDEPQKSDMHHLFPCRSNVNSSRGNDPFAEISDEETDKWYRDDYYLTTIPEEYIDEYAEKLNHFDERFEPREDHKGNTARAMFYFNAIYNNVADQTFWDLQKDDLLDWNYLDEVDPEELERTWEIASYQDNPNPFVLDNSLALRIWFEDQIVYGCTDPSSPNFNPEANVNDGSCLNIMGDLNNDSEVNILDIVMMVDWILSSYIPSEEQLAVGDLSGDGSIDVLDVVALVELIVFPPSVTQLTVYVQGFYEQNLLIGTSTITIGDSTFTTENGLITVNMPQGTYEFNATNPNTWDNLAFWNDDYLGMSDEQTSRPYEMRHGDDHSSPITLDQEVQNVYANKIDLTYPFGETFMDLGPQVVAFADPSPLVVNTSYEIPDETRTGWLNDYVTDVSAIPHAENLISEIQYLAEMPETPHTWVAFSNDFPPPGSNYCSWNHQTYEIIDGSAMYPLWPSKVVLYIEIFQAMFRGIDDPAVLYNNGGDDVGFNARGNRDIAFSSFWGNGFWVTTPD